MEMGWGAPLAEDSWLGLLAWFPTQMRLQNGIYDCLSSLSGLCTIFCSRWDYELASLLWQGSRPGHRDCIAHCLLVQIQAECALNSLLRPPALLCSWGKPWAVLCSSGTALQLSRWTRPLALLCTLSTLPALLSAPALLDHTSFKGLLPIFLVRLGQVIVLQSLSHVWLFVYPQTAECQASLSFTLPEFAQIHVHWVGEWVWSQSPEDPLEEGWQPTPVFLPGESHKQRSLVGYSP